MKEQQAAWMGVLIEIGPVSHVLHVA
jgi:hypothetical protein